MHVKLGLVALEMLKDAINSFWELIYAHYGFER